MNALSGLLSLVGLAFVLALWTGHTEQTAGAAEIVSALALTGDGQRMETGKGGEPDLTDNARSDSLPSAKWSRQQQRAPRPPRVNPFKFATAQGSKDHLPKSLLPAWLLHVDGGRLTFSQPSLQVLFCTWLL